jgi:hypothetical protein
LCFEDREDDLALLDARDVFDVEQFCVLEQLAASLFFELAHGEQFVHGAFVVGERTRLIVVALLLLAIRLERALHLADHSAAAPVDAVSVAVKSAVVAAVLTFESLAAIVTFWAVVPFKAFRSFEALGALGAFLRALGLAVGTALEAFTALVASVVSAFDALAPFRPVVANDVLVTLCALEPLGSFYAVGSFHAVGSVDAVGSFDAIWSVDAVGSFDAVGALGARQPFGSIGAFVAVGSIGEPASLCRQIDSLGALAALVYLVDASVVDAHGRVIRIGGSRGASAAAGTRTHAARRLRG